MDGGLALGRQVGDVRVQRAGQLLPALFKAFCQVAFHQSQPVGIGNALVLGVHGRNRIFTVLNRGQCTFQTDIRDTCRIVLADGRVRVDHDLDQQTILAQEHVAALVVTSQLCGISQSGFSTADCGHQRTIAHLKCLNVGPRAICQRGRFV